MIKQAKVILYPIFVGFGKKVISALFLTDTEAPANFLVDTELPPNRLVCKF
jgi:hypothetical protein